MYAEQQKNPEKIVEPKDDQLERIRQAEQAAQAALEASTTKYLGIGVNKPIAEPGPPIEPVQPKIRPGESIRSFLQSDRWQEYCRQDIVYKEALRQWERRQENKGKPRWTHLAKVFHITFLDIRDWFNMIVPGTDRSIEKIIPASVINPEKRRVRIEPNDERRAVERLAITIRQLKQRQAELGSSKQFNIKRLEQEGTRASLLEEKKYRAKLKRDLDKQIEMYDVAILKCKNLRHKLQREIREWDDNPKHFLMQTIPGTGTIVPEKIVYAPPKTFQQLIIDGKGFCTVSKDKLDAYLAWATDPEVRPYPGLGSFENFLIRAAIHAGVFRPQNLDKILEQYPWIKWENEQLPETDDNEYSIEEKQAILKNDAAQGVTIYGAGYDAKGRPRNLSSFNTAGQHTRSESAPQREGGWSGDVESNTDGDDS